MKREQWERLKTLFNGALDQPPETRYDWLNRQAGGDEMLAREAAALLRAHETAEGFLETPVTVHPADVAGIDDPQGGVRLGSYEIEYEIGNRPAWVGVPLGGLRALLRDRPTPDNLPEKAP